MGIMEVTVALRKKLGDAATAGLVALLDKVQTERDESLLYVIEDRIALRIKESEAKLRGEMHAGFMNVERRFGQIESKFESRFAGLERQITHQTRWLISLIGILGLILGVLDYLLE